MRGDPPVPVPYSRDWCWAIGGREERVTEHVRRGHLADDGISVASPAVEASQYGTCEISIQSESNPTIPAATL
eukprot:CAMPEP_0194337136 /NCGR_PEP_ID=MMETSP0171-20130528/75308_1 /TAXON_ID=218684 /ORGANISM="Corethron pennatum, Strain L29A3" /LENGTH=72 /DNA_ID=CAMNT_0039100803 /DNA_START=1040 /DNA_END=1258 /DNA_ORIENTATION=-